MEILIFIILTVIFAAFVSACWFLYDHIQDWYDERLEREWLRGFKMGQISESVEFGNYSEEGENK